MVLCTIGFRHLQHSLAVEERLTAAERELRVQFTWIAQLQVELDLVSAALRGSSGDGKRQTGSFSATPGRRPAHRPVSGLIETRRHRRRARKTRLDVTLSLAVFGVPLQHDHRLIVRGISARAIVPERGRQLTAEDFHAAPVQPAREVHVAVTPEFLSGWIGGFRSTIAIQHDEVTGLRFDDDPVVLDLGEQTERKPGEPIGHGGARCLEPAPFVARGAVPQRRRVPGVRHHEQLRPCHPTATIVA